MNFLKPKNAKLPLPPAETARIRGYRDMLDTAIKKINEVIAITHAEIIEEAAAKKAAREAAAAQQAEAAPLPPTPRPRPRPARNQTAEPRQAKPENPDAKPQARPAPEPDLRPRRGTRPEIALLYLVRAMDTFIRLDTWLGERLASAHTTAELAGLNHPNRQPILDYLHKMTRFEQPYQFQRTTHDALETRITEELAWAPNRNPADIIVEICTHLNLPFDPEDFPNNWRPSPPQDPPPKPREDPDWNDPEVQREIYQNIQDEMENRRLRGLDE